MTVCHFHSIEFTLKHSICLEVQPLAYILCVCFTYNVLSLGMWLKLDTGMALMLLLFSVLWNIKQDNVQLNFILPKANSV